MCCLLTVLLFFGSRLTILFWWLMDPMRFSLAFREIFPLFMFRMPGWLWTLLGAIFLPWTTLAYVLVFPSGIAGWEWLLLIIAFLADLGAYGGTYRNRHHYRN